MHTSQINDPSQGGKALLKLVVLCYSEETKFEDTKELASRRLLRYQEGEVTKPF